MSGINAAQAVVVKGQYPGIERVAGVGVVEYDYWLVMRYSTVEERRAAEAGENRVVNLGDQAWLACVKKATEGKIRVMS
ncbi:MAG: hypothetical protein IPM81_16640 [Saprospirales bacterium]|nr:hypothetical protein [Saprospirales bacterium]